jgi:hypothetical protein
MMPKNLSLVISSAVLFVDHHKSWSAKLMDSFYYFHHRVKGWGGDEGFSSDEPLGLDARELRIVFSPLMIPKSPISVG